MVEVQTENQANNRLIDSSISQQCICPAFRQYRCVWRIDRKIEGGLLITVMLPDRNHLSDLIDDLRQRGASVKLHRISLRGSESDGQSIKIEVGSLTDKQRDAIRVAVELGYYDSPKKTDLTDVAEELGISPSAASRRLNAVETKLVLETVREIEVTSVSSTTTHARISGD